MDVKEICKNVSKENPPPDAVERKVESEMDFTLASLSGGGGFLTFAKSDAAKLNEITRDVFVNCDNASADASNRPAERARLREFARKEVLNNSYARGLTLLVAGDTVGRGPTLRVSNSVKNANRIEESFADWVVEINLAEKLRTARIAKMVDGEVFGVFYKDRKLKHPSKFNIKFLESEQIGTPLGLAETDDVDGIDVDEYGDPTFYYVFKEHPGSSYKTSFDEYIKVPASSIVHWFRTDRPGQHRGVTEFAPSLMLFYMLRRYTAATLDAAETAANFPIVIYTDSPAIENIRSNSAPFMPVHLSRGKATSLPEGWKMGQVKPEQPTTTYSEFKREIIAEIARCFCIPVNVLSGDSSQHNYASGRLDYQTYYRAIEIERRSCEVQVLQKIFERWYEQTFLKNNSETFDPSNWNVGGEPPKISWFWDGFAHVDPDKKAKAQAKRLASGTTTIAYEMAKQGIDPERHFQELIQEQKYLRLNGVEVAHLKGLSNGN